MIPPVISEPAAVVACAAFAVRDGVVTRKRAVKAPVRGSDSDENFSGSDADSDDFTAAARKKRAT